MTVLGLPVPTVKRGESASPASIYARLCADPTHRPDDIHNVHSPGSSAVCILSDLCARFNCVIWAVRRRRSRVVRQCVACYLIVLFICLPRVLQRALRDLLASTSISGSLSASPLPRALRLPRMHPTPHLSARNVEEPSILIWVFITSIHTC